MVASRSSPAVGFRGHRRITTSRHEVAGRCVEGGDLAGNASALLGELEVRPLMGKAAAERSDALLGRGASARRACSRRGSAR
jgi:hypothetical protein